MVHRGWPPSHIWNDTPIFPSSIMVICDGSNTENFQYDYEQEADSFPTLSTKCLDGYNYILRLFSFYISTQGISLHLAHFTIDLCPSWIFNIDNNTHFGNER